MTSDKVYTVTYAISQWSTETNYICVLARNKEEAYEKAVFEDLPRTFGHSPYAAWVSSVTYNNGNYKKFNTFPGKAF